MVDTVFDRQIGKIMKVLCEHEIANVSGGTAADTVFGSFEEYYFDGTGGGGSDLTTGDFARLDRSITVVDYCGTETTAYIPDSVWGVNLAGACSAHDDCYRAMIVPRNTCDSQFLTNMLNASGSNLLGIGTSYLYYSAVVLFGGGAYGQ